MGFPTRWHQRHVLDGRVRLKQSGGRLQVVGPYNEEFRDAARKLGGRWRYRSRLWSFNIDRADQVVAAIWAAYGVDAIYEE